MCRWVVLALAAFQVRVVVALLVPSEAQAMQQLQRALQVHTSSWPPLEDPCTRWQGVQCSNSSDHVDTIKLSQLPRVLDRNTGDVPLDGFRALVALRELNASGFALGRSIPDWFFSSLGALQVLDLTDCGLFGSIPWTLGNLVNLTFLSLARNNITGDIPATIGNLRNLTTLNLSFNRLSRSIPDSLFNATSLVNVDLSYNNLTGQLPSSVGNLRNSQFFIASHNELTGVLPPEVGSLASLTQLDLSHNNISGPITGEVGKMSNLMFLSLATNNFSGAFPATIANCTKLIALNIRENIVRGVLPETIGQLRNLVTLDVSSNRVTGLLPLGLASLQVLATVDVAHNYFFGPVLEELVGVASLQVLNVSYNFFNGSVPVGLLARTVTKKNCLSKAPGQHALRTCLRFYARKNVVFDAPATPPVTTPDTQPAESSRPNETTKSKHLVPILSGVLGGVGLLFIIASLVFCIHRCVSRKNRGSGRTNGSLSGSVRGGSNRVTPPAVPTSRMGEVFSYAQLQQATKNFSLTNLISNGHSGDLYKGLLESGAMVAVKRIDLTKVKMETYLQELEVLGRASHTRLVLLLGHCLDGDDEKFLVYKYTPNGDLASALHQKGSPGPCEDVLQSLDWITRLKIAIGVAEALSYLHSECSPPIVHRYSGSTQLYPKRILHRTRIRY